MEALWNMEEKWKLTTQEAIVLLACAASAVIGLCAAVVLKRKAQEKKTKNITVGLEGGKWSEPNCHWVSVKRALMGSVRWSEAAKWERSPQLLGVEGGSLGWQSHNSESPVWQRPILMGEKCAMPRFSGLILYDERGQLIDQSLNQGSLMVDNVHQEKSVAVVGTTLKDLL
ncbi:hypothetical protein HS088_TW19G00366 [Tripterygium wilfordii]|uniref:Uncharacterized protein n=1 Tax=Tripterygium wilfordii TaxID=458696 RepID=A0A7J7C9J5_TRIWF|nr:hypothetical protein HS088_TW19G00366 [Tripterygium wilfordii]